MDCNYITDTRTPMLASSMTYEECCAFIEQYPITSYLALPETGFSAGLDETSASLQSTERHTTSGPHDELCQYHRGISQRIRQLIGQRHQPTSLNQPRGAFCSTGFLGERSEEKRATHIPSLQERRRGMRRRLVDARAMLGHPQKRTDRGSELNILAPVRFEHAVPTRAKQLEQTEKIRMRTGEKQQKVNMALVDAQASDGWHRQMLEHSPDMIYVLSLQGRFLYVSPASKRLLGISPDDIVGKDFASICHPADVAPTFRKLNELLQAGANRHHNLCAGEIDAEDTGPYEASACCFLVRLRHRDKGFIWMESMSTSMFETSRKRKYFLFSARPRPLPFLDAKLLDFAFWNHDSAVILSISKAGLILNIATMSSWKVEGMHTSDSELLSAFAPGRHLKGIVADSSWDCVAVALETTVPSFMTTTLKSCIDDESIVVGITVLPATPYTSSALVAYVQLLDVSLVNAFFHRNNLYHRDVAWPVLACFHSFSSGERNTDALQISSALQAFDSGAVNWEIELQNMKRAKRKYLAALRSRDSHLVSAM